jgi:hypothetical protein
MSFIKPYKLGDIDVNEDDKIRNIYTKFDGTFDLGWFGDKYETGQGRKASFDKCFKSCGVTGKCDETEKTACRQSSINQNRMMEIAEKTLQNKQATNVRFSTHGVGEHRDKIRYLIKRILLHQHLSKELKEYTNQITKYIDKTGSKPTIVLTEPPNWNENTDNYLQIVLNASFSNYPTPWRTKEHLAKQQSQQQYDPRNDMNIYILIGNDNKPVITDGKYSVYSNYPNFNYSVMDQNINTLPPNDSMRIVKSTPILVILAPNLTSDKHKLINITVPPEGIKLITPTEASQLPASSSESKSDKKESSVGNEEVQKLKTILNRKKKDNKKLKRELNRYRSSSDSDREEPSRRGNSNNNPGRSNIPSDRRENPSNNPERTPNRRYSNKQNPLDELEGLIGKIQREKSVTRDHLIGLLEILRNIIGNK